MKNYIFKAVSPYSNERTEICFADVPDDFKFCETYRYRNELKGYDVSFLIFFYKYDEALFNQINSLSKGKGFDQLHTHAYRIKDYMVGNFHSVEVVSGNLPCETIDELNARFLDVFANHLIKVEQETDAYRYAEEELCRLSIGVEPEKWTDEDKQRYAEASERLHKETQFYTLYIRRFLGFENHTQQLEINTACVWFDEPRKPQRERSLRTR